MLLLHGFPELAYSWRKVMLPLAAAGYHVIAPDQRGYGRTIGWDDSYDADPDPFRILNMVRDAIGLVYALGYRSVAMVVGHDAGAPVASWSALIRPDIFRSVTIMSSPFEGAPSLPFDTANGAAPAAPGASPTTNSMPNSRSSTRRGSTTRTISAPAAPTTTCCMRRKACTPSSAPTTTTRAPITKGTSPHPLKARTAEEMAQIPTYYVMEKDKGMAATVAPFMPSADEIAQLQMADRGRGRGVRDRIRQDRFHRRAAGLSRAARLGSQKHRRDAHVLGPHHRRALAVHRGQERLGRLSDARAPSTRCRTSACTRMVGFHLLDGAGHWVQQEQPETGDGVADKVPAGPISTRRP